MIDLKSALYAHLKNVYHREAPPDASMPYLIYKLEIYDDGQEFQRVILDVDGWDAPADGDCIPLENLMEETNKLLDKVTISGTSFAATFYLDRKLTIDDPDVTIERRRYTYEGRLFKFERS